MSHDFFHPAILSDSSASLREEVKERLQVLNRGQMPAQIVPLESLEAWRFEESSGNLVHQSGRFFEVRGLQASLHSTLDWYQPIIYQPEIGILGILVQNKKGIPHFLMQLKWEPGNRNGFQISPTVQATQSNYFRIHGGRETPFLSFFLEKSGHTQSWVDLLQPEQGSWFCGKKNRNMVVEVAEEIPLKIPPNYIWFTLQQIRHLLKERVLVNMDARSVLSCLFPKGGAQRETVAMTMAPKIHWLNELRQKTLVQVRTVGLRDLPSLKREKNANFYSIGDSFELIGVHAHSKTREVETWFQPMIHQKRTGWIGFLTARKEGILHFLVQAIFEVGNPSKLLLGPTVQYWPGMSILESSSLYLHLLMDARPENILLDTCLSEEGGRFYHAENHYRVVEVKSSDLEPIKTNRFVWMTFEEIQQLIQLGLLNIEGRSLVSCLGDHLERFSTYLPAAPVRKTIGIQTKAESIRI